MEYVLIGFIAFGVIIFVVSLFQKDPYKQLKVEVDQMNMQHIQDMYKVKKKLKLLEEELLFDDLQLHQPIVKQENHAPKVDTKEVHAIIKNQVVLLHRQGLTIEQIAKQSSLDAMKVQAIVTEMKFRGELHE